MNLQPTTQAFKYIRRQECQSKFLSDNELNIFESLLKQLWKNKHKVRIYILRSQLRIRYYLVFIPSPKLIHQANRRLICSG